MWISKRFCPLSSCSVSSRSIDDSTCTSTAPAPQNQLHLFIPMLGRHRRSITYHTSMTLRILVGCHIFNSAFAERGWGWGGGVGGRWVDGLLYIQWFDPSNIVGEQHVNVTKFKIRSGVLRIQKNMSWHKNTGSEFFETQETLYNGYFPLLSYFWHICTARNMYFPRVEREGKRTLGPVSQSLLERERERERSLTSSSGGGMRYCRVP